MNKEQLKAKIEIFNKFSPLKIDIDTRGEPKYWLIVKGETVKTISQSGLTTDQLWDLVSSLENFVIYGGLENA